MSKLSDDLRNMLKIFNSYSWMTYAVEHGAKDVPFISFRPIQHGRGYRSAAWQVILPGRRTDTEAAWYDNGHKTFIVSDFGDRTKENQLAAALTWASERYGVTDWVRLTLLGTAYVPCEAHVIVMTDLKAARKAATASVKED